MPLYDFTCESGHTAERLASVETDLVFCACGLPARRSAVNHVAHNRLHNAAEFVMTEPMRAAHDEALGRKQEALAAKAEYEGNGWKP